MAKEQVHHGDRPPPGVHDLTSPSAMSKKGAAAHTGFYRIRVFLPTVPEAGAPDLVVAARDDIEAEALCYRQLGIRSVNKSENTVEITAVPESDFIRSQARRLGVDLRQHMDAEGKLTWAPQGHKAQKTYYVSATGELSDKKPETEG
ncbi:MAG TPA: hypothetical protein VKE94_10215 [Gemmataceae bacterium]|nr:hypothetical protein [Gemmataceae bacterium]